mgnify:FL=1
MNFRVALKQQTFQLQTELLSETNISCLDLGNTYKKQGYHLTSAQDEVIQNKILAHVPLECLSVFGEHVDLE